MTFLLRLRAPTLGRLQFDAKQKPAGDINANVGSPAVRPVSFSSMRSRRERLARFISPAQVIGRPQGTTTGRGCTKRKPPASSQAAKSREERPRRAATAVALPQSIYNHSRLTAQLNVWLTNGYEGLLGSPSKARCGLLPARRSSYDQSKLSLVP